MICECFVVWEMFEALDFVNVLSFEKCLRLWILVMTLLTFAAYDMVRTLLRQC